MKRIFLAAAAALAISGAATLTPANAQGVGVQVGPLGVGVGAGPYWDDPVTGTTIAIGAATVLMVTRANAA